MIAAGSLSPEDVARVLAQIKVTREKGHSILVRLHVIHQERWVGFLSREYGVQPRSHPQQRLHRRDPRNRTGQGMKALLP